MICSLGAENTGCKYWSFSRFLIFYHIAEGLTVNEEILLKTFGDFFSQSFLQK